jgi:hypothetical protein
MEKPFVRRHPLYLEKVVVRGTTLKKVGEKRIKGS